MEKSAAHWKEKYLSNLEDLDRKEKDRLEVEKSLRRCISRLSLIGDGGNPKLDKQLERLRNSVRGEKNIVRLQRMVDGIVEAAAGNADTASPVLAIAELIESIKWPPGLGKGVTRLRKSLKKRDAESEWVVHVKTLTSLLNDAIDRALSKVPDINQEEIKKKGMFSSFFGGSKKDGSTEELHNITTLEEKDELLFASKMLLELLGRIRLSAELQNIVAKLKDRCRDLETRQTLNDVLTDIGKLVSDNANVDPSADDLEPVSPGIEIHEVLIQLVERLHVPEDLLEQAEDLKSQWEYGIEADKVVDALSKIADLVIDIRMRVEKERGELQDFLQQLTSQLELIDEHIQEDLNDYRESYKTNKEFGQAVDGQMKDMQSDVRDATAVEDLKGIVSNRLSAIQHHMDNFKEREEKRNEHMEKRVEILNDRLRTMENESDELKEKIAEEQQNAIRDALTGVANRLGWNKRIEYEYSRWRRYHSPLSIIVWDIDDFKKVNDTYGHKAGDKVLTKVAHILRDKIRNTDFLARFGGEEFITLLPEASLDDAIIAAEKLRKSIGDCEFHHGDKPVPITASAGVTEFKNGDTEESVFERADQFLYIAKRTGKNCCVSDKDKK